MKRDEKERNEAEWRNPDNWVGPKWIAVYRSANDTRLLVPKKVPAMGWTFNFAKPLAWVLLFLILQMVVVVVVIALIAKRS